MSAPGKLVRSSRWKTGPSKGQRPLGSECCVNAGNTDFEVDIEIGSQSHTFHISARSKLDS